MKTWMLVLLVPVAVVAFLILPVAVMWSLNTLFPALAIPYTFETWCAMASLLVTLHAICGDFSFTVTRS